MAWADSRATVDQNEAEDAYMARIRFTGVTELGASTGSGGHGFLWAGVGAGGALAIGGLLILLVLRSRRPAAGGAGAAGGDPQPARP